MVYHIIIYSIHNIVSIKPLNHNIDIITCVKNNYVLFRVKLIPSCTISQKNRISGLVRPLLSNVLIHTKPTSPAGAEILWFTSLDSTGGVRYCH